jgi:hypothetical protein
MSRRISQSTRKYLINLLTKGTTTQQSYQGKAKKKGLVFPFIFLIKTG